MLRFIRPAIVGLLMLGALVSQADAQLQCLSPGERVTFDLQALRSELMVLATGCGDVRPYNAFIERYRPELMENEQAISSYFRHKYGRRGRQEHDSFVTALANAQADQASRLGSEFCPRNGQIFQEAMALHSGGELRPFAAGQALFPRSMDICPVEVAQDPPRRPVHRASLRNRRR